MEQIDTIVDRLDGSVSLKDFLKKHLRNMYNTDRQRYMDTIEELKETTKPINIENTDELDRYLSKINHAFVEEKGLWDVSDTSKIAQSIGINFANSWYNEYSFNYVMNMLRADFYEAISKFSKEYPNIKQYILENPKLYAYLAQAWLEDVDAPKSKLMLYLHNIIGE